MKKLIFLLSVLSLGVNAQIPTKAWAETEFLNKISSWGSIEPKKILEAIRSEKICVKVLKSATPQFELTEFEWGDVERPAADMSNLGRWTYFDARVYCQNELDLSDNCTTILINDKAGRVDILREYLRAKIMLTDAKLYCPAKAGQGTAYTKEINFEIANFLYENRNRFSYKPIEKIRILRRALIAAWALRTSRPEAYSNIKTQEFDQEFEELKQSSTKVGRLIKDDKSNSYLR